MDTMSKPLTLHGHAYLADEHEWLSKNERPRVLNMISTAAAEGDRSENAEYIYGKKRLREIDRRLRYLNKLLTDAKIIDQLSLSGNRVCFGSTVYVSDASGNRYNWTIVGEGESDYHEMGISWKSPVAKALWAKRIGEVVNLIRPKDEMEVEIVDVKFGVYPAKDIRVFKFDET